MADVAPAEALAFGEEQDLYEMANLYPRDTGLPMTIWVSPRGHARHDARVKVCRTPGDRMDADNVAVVAIRPRPRLLHGELATEDLRAVQHWIGANSALLIDYWEGRASTAELIRGMRSV